MKVVDIATPERLPAMLTDIVGDPKPACCMLRSDSALNGFAGSNMLDRISFDDHLVPHSSASGPSMVAAEAALAPSLEAGNNLVPHVIALTDHAIPQSPASGPSLAAVDPVVAPATQVLFLLTSCTMLQLSLQWRCFPC